MVKRILLLIKKNGMTAKQLTQLLEINSSTVSEWKRGKIKPTIDVLIRISLIFDVSLDWLITGREKHHNVFSYDEIKLVSAFRELDDREKMMILERVQTLIDIKPNKNPDKIIDLPKKEPPPKPEPDEPEDPEIEMLVYDQPSSAGRGNYLDYATYDKMTFKESDIPYGADFGVRISGDSMEPLISNKEVVWVREQAQIENGQIGIFILDDEAYCKRLYIDYDNQVLQLLSENEKYEPMTVEKHQDLRTIGRVLL